MKEKGKEQRRRWRRAAGFTLIELLFVMVLIGLISAVAWPRLNQLSGAYLRQAAERLASVIRLTYDAAVVHNKVYRLQLELDRSPDKPQTYWIEVEAEPAPAGAADEKKEEERPQEKRDPEDNAADFVADPTVLSAPQQLPPGVFFGGLFQPYLERRLERGQAHLQFYPDGSVDRSLIYLSDEEGKRFYTLVVHPLTGAVRIERGKIENESDLENR
jgi:prepilin-type N-terminal cleavage/methylation domain-containing protein